MAFCFNVHFPKTWKQPFHVSDSQFELFFKNVVYKYIWYDMFGATKFSRFSYKMKIAYIE